MSSPLSDSVQVGKFNMFMRGSISCMYFSLSTPNTASSNNWELGLFDAQEPRNLPR